MATLGMLASGLGHDLRNLVMPVLLRLDVVAASPELSDKARSDLASIRQSITRLQRLAGGLRLLATDPFDQRGEAQLTTLHDWWHEMQPIVIDALPPHTIVDGQVGDVLPVVAVPPGTLAQILISLVMNSRQAMEHTGVPQLSIVGRADGNTVLLDVTDNGEGMDEETRRRCFEPYFTTRTRQYATGLGLSTGRALLNRHGGDLVLADPLPVGTRFTMSMPVHQPEVTKGERAPRRVHLSLRDPRQLAMMRLLLRHRGFVETVSDSADLVICDTSTVDELAGQVAAMKPPGALRDIIAIGTPPASGLPVPVRWVNPNDFSVLDDVLH